MKDEAWAFAGGLSIGCGLMGVVLVLAGGYGDDVRREAVLQGHARYVVTAEREVKFEWVDCARKEQSK